MYMKRLSFLIIFSILLLLIQSACVGSKAPVEAAVASTATPMIAEVVTATDPVVEASETLSAATAVAFDYTECGTGPLIDVPFFFPDDHGTFSPTQIIQDQWTDDKVIHYVKVISCLKQDESRESDPSEVEKGIENSIVFFDKHGKGHSYRIIIGGHYVAPYDPTHKDITASVDGVQKKFYTVDEWKGITQETFASRGSRQIGLDVYLEDTQGDLSKVLKEVYQFKDVNLQIESALQSGEGYPDQVPDGFFLFAMESWLINPE